MDPLSIGLAVLGLVGTGITVYKSGIWKRYNKKNYKLWKNTMKDVYSILHSLPMDGDNYKFYKKDIKSFAKTISDELEYDPNIVKDIKKLVLEMDVNDLDDKMNLIEYIKEGIRLRKESHDHKKKELLSKINMVKDMLSNKDIMKNRDKKKNEKKIEYLNEWFDTITDCEYYSVYDTADLNKIAELDMLLQNEKVVEVEEIAIEDMEGRFTIKRRTANKIAELANLKLTETVKVTTIPDGIIYPQLKKVEESVVIPEGERRRVFR